MINSAAVSLWIRNRFLSTLLVLTWAGCLMGVGPLFASDNKITFTFAPPDGLSYARIVTSTKTLMQDATQRATTEEMKMRVLFRKTDDGFLMEEQITGIKAFSNNKEVELTFLQRASIGSSMSVSMTHNGKATASSGSDALLDKMSKAPENSLPSATLKRLLDMGSAAAQDEWNYNVSELSGKTVKIGDVLSTKSVVLTPYGAVTVPSRTTIGERLDYNGKQCVRLKTEYRANDAAYLRAQQKAIDELGRSMELGAMPQAASAEVVGAEERIVDPATMLFYSESVDRTSKVALTPETSDATTRTLHYKKEVSYEY